MAKASEWSLDGKKAAQRDVAEALALARQHTAKRSRTEREAREMDANARKVGAALRKQTRQSIGCRPAQFSGRHDGGVRLRGFELTIGLMMSTWRSSSSGGMSSFHFKLTPRGLGSRRQASGRLYKRGEAVRAIRYIFRNAAREINDGGIVSNISHDPDVLASVFAALEELEMLGGRDNANVYNSLIMSLPSELTSDERERLLGAICQFLADNGLGYAGVLHAPDPEGDQRNFHAHVMFSWRPLDLAQNGCTFSVETLGSLNTPDFVTRFRTHAATVMNQAMAVAGQPRRFTAEKTRSGPGSSTKDKHGPGRKHHERRADNVARAHRELSLRKKRQAAIGAAIEATKDWLIQDIVDRRPIIAAITARENAIVASVAAAKVAAAAISTRPPDAHAVGPIAQTTPSVAVVGQRSAMPVGVTPRRVSDAIAVDPSTHAVPPTPANHPSSPTLSVGTAQHLTDARLVEPIAQTVPSSPASGPGSPKPIDVVPQRLPEAVVVEPVAGTRAQVPVGEQPSAAPPTIPVSHAKLPVPNVDRILDTRAAEPVSNVKAPVHAVSESEPARQAGSSIPAVAARPTHQTPVRKEPANASRRNYFAALGKVRRRFATRKPDHQQADRLGQTESLSGVRGLCTLELVRDLGRPAMLLRGLSQDQLAVKSSRAAGDGVRRAGDRDHGIDRGAEAGGLTGPRSAPMQQAPVDVPRSTPTHAPAAPPKRRPTETLRDVVRNRQLNRPSQEPAAQAAMMAALEKRVLPIAQERVATDDGVGRSRLVFTLEVAVPEDKKLIAEAIRFQYTAEMQALLTRKFAEFLERVRVAMAHAPSKQSPRSKLERLDWGGGSDARLRAAVYAAWDSDQLREIVEQTQASLMEEDPVSNLAMLQHLRGRGGTGR